MKYKRIMEGEMMGSKELEEFYFKKNSLPELGTQDANASETDNKAQPSRACCASAKPTSRGEARGPAVTKIYGDVF